MDTIGVGIVGLSGSGGWGQFTHLPAVQAVDGVELRGLAGSSPESARRTTETLGLDPALAFADVSALAADDGIDVVTVVVKVPHHFELVQAALDAGKAVLCEWPLARNTAEAEELAERARAAGVRTFCGMQAYSNPVIRHVAGLIKDGDIGTVLSTTLTGTVPVWGATCTSYDEFTADHDNGATLSRIGMGHALAGMHLALGMPEQLTGTAVVTRPVQRNTETGADVPKTSADVIAASGVLPSGGVFSAHFRGGVATPLMTQWWTDGTEGSIVVNCPQGSLQYGPYEVTRIRPGGATETLTPPASYGPGYPDLIAPAASIAYEYALLRDDLRDGTNVVPDFDAAVELHQFMDRMEDAAGVAATA